MAKLTLQLHQRVDPFLWVALEVYQGVGCVRVTQHVRMDFNSKPLSRLHDDSVQALAVTSIGLSKVIQEESLLIFA